jgi:hypothetical protein
LWFYCLTAPSAIYLQRCLRVSKWRELALELARSIF